MTLLIVRYTDFKLTDHINQLTSLTLEETWHFIKLETVQREGETYPLHILIEQVKYFGPFPLNC